MNSPSGRARNTGLIGAFALICFAACSTVTMRQPLSAPEVPADREKLEGTWVLEEEQESGRDVIPMEIHISSSGVAQLAGVDWRDDAPRLEVSDAVFTSGKRANYLSARESIGEENASNGFFLAQWKLMEGGYLVVWPPEAEAFARLVEKKRLKGKIHRDGSSVSVHLTGDPASILNALEDPKNFPLFKYEDPFILRKLDLP